MSEILKDSTMEKLTSGHYYEDGTEYTKLALAIVHQAVIDYRNALRSAKRQIQIDGIISKLTGGKLRELERFFRSEWCQWLVNDEISGDEIIKRVRGDVFQEGRKW